MSEALGPMNSLYQSMCSLFPPRLPRFGREDVASTAEYYNRLARNHEATINPLDLWMRRISTQPVMRIRPFRTAKKVPRRKRTVVLAGSFASTEYPWLTQALRTLRRTLRARPVWINKDQLLSKVLNWARRLGPYRQRFIRSATLAKAFLLWR